MPRGRLANQQDGEDFICGSLFFGTGGGGDPERGRLFLNEALQAGLNIEWVDPSDILDEDWTCTAYGMGSIAPLSAETESNIQRMNLVDQLSYRALDVAVQELALYAGVRMGVLVPAELGPSNTPAPLVTAARLGLKVVDGDYAGRAVPEEMQSTHSLFGQKSWPFTSVDRWGDITIVKEVCNPLMMERIGKMLSVAAYRGCAIASTLLRASDMKRSVVPGTLTRCLELGRAIRRACEANQDPIQAAVAFTNGWLLFEGEVTAKNWQDCDGYMIGTTHLQGTGIYSGHRFEVWFKNENHISWLDQNPLVCSPDLLVIADQTTGEGITNTRLERGMKVSVVGVKGLEAFRTEAGLAAAGPQHFGFTIDYQPIEVLANTIGFSPKL